MGAGRGRKPPTTRATGAQVAVDGNDKRMGGPRTELPPRPQRGTAADGISTGTPTRHTAGTDDARPDHGTLLRRKYGLLAPTGTAVDPSNAGEPGSTDGHEATWEQAGPNGR